MAQLFDNDIREMPNVYDFKDWLLNRISAFMAPFHHAIWRLMVWVGD
jgi:hypothetical protein